MKKHYKLAVLLTIVLGVLGAALCFSQFVVKEIGLDTNGDTRGIALKDYYVFLADGKGGLKVVNMSNRYAFIIKGVLPLPGSFIEQVAADGDTVVLTDTKNNQVHFVDVWNTSDPELKGTLKTKGDTPQAVAVEGGMAFVVEFGKNPSDPNYFSGIEVFSYGEKITSIQLKKLDGIRDIIVTKKYVYVGGGIHLYTFKRSPSGLDSNPIAKLKVSAGEALNGLSLCEQYLFAFGKKQLYAVDISDPYKLKIVDQKPVPGDPKNRKVDAAVLDWGDQVIVYDPDIYVLITTLNSYGLFKFHKPTGKLGPFSLYDLEASKVILMRDTKGKVNIYDAAFSKYFYPGAFKGGTFALGALGDYGLGYVQVGWGL